MESSCLSTKQSSWKCGRKEVCEWLYTYNPDCKSKWNLRRLFIRQRNYLLLALNLFVLEHHPLTGVCSYEYSRQRHTSSSRLVSRSVLFTFFLIYTTFWFGGQNRWRLRFWEHTPISSRFVNNLFSQTTYLRVVWISSGAVRILGSVYHVCIDTDSISSSLKEEARYMIMELSTLVFLIRYSTTVNIQKAVLLTTHPREQHLNGSKDIFIILVAILGYLICSSYLTNYVSF